GIDFQHANSPHRPLVTVLWLLATGLLFTTWQHWQRMEEQQLQTDELEQHFIQLTRRQEQLIQAKLLTAVPFSPVSGPRLLAAT
ncbi:hypothetical protein Q6293_28900, partial [Klebsiella pneumoniae]|uniref:hypothetical protein n=1 Tax=Klebsiella pneumoniae TaxID=573 RepID=UPI00272EFAEA